MARGQARRLVKRAARQARGARDLPPAAVAAGARARSPHRRGGLVRALGPLRAGLRRRRRGCARGSSELHAEAAAASALTFVASEALAELEREAGRDATVIGLSAGDFPAPDPDGTVVALSLGHLGWRTDWALLRGVADRLGDRLVLLLVGDWHEDEVGGDPDFQACRAHPSLVWLGRRSDEEAARLILTADVGHRPVRAERVQRRPRCRTGSSSTPSSAAARSCATCPARTRGSTR